MTLLSVNCLIAISLQPLLAAGFTGLGCINKLICNINVGISVYLYQSSVVNDSTGKEYYHAILSINGMPRKVDNRIISFISNPKYENFPI